MALNSSMMQRRLALQEILRKKREAIAKRAEEVQQTGKAKTPIPSGSTAAKSQNVQPAKISQTVTNTRTGKTVQPTKVDTKSVRKQQPLTDLITTSVAKSGQSPFSVIQQSKQPDQYASRIVNMAPFLDSTGKVKQYADISTSDLYAMAMELPAETQKQFIDQFSKDYEKQPGTQFYAPYRAKGSNNEEFVKYWGTADAETIVKDPANDAYLRLLDPTRTGLAPKTPTKKSSAAEWKAYTLFYAKRDYQDEQAAFNELPSLQQQLGDLATAYPDASDDEIMGMVDWNATDEEGKQAYKTVKQYRDAAAEGMKKWTVRGGLYVSDADLKAVIHAARRGEDVSQVKDYLMADAGYKHDKLMQPEYTPVEELTGYKKKEPEKPVSIFERAANAGKQVISSAAAGIADMNKQIGITGTGNIANQAIFSGQNPVASVTTDIADEAIQNAVEAPGTIDLRDQNITPDQWDTLILYGLASQEQADALRAQQQAQPAEYTGMTQMVPATQASGAKKKTATVKELVALKNTLLQELTKLNAGVPGEKEIPEIDNEIEKLTVEQQYAADPEAVNGRLDSLYQQKAAILGSGNEQATRASEESKIRAALDNVNQGISQLRAHSAAKAAEKPETPAETPEQYMTRMLSTDIGELSGDIETLDTMGKDALEKYNELTDKINQFQMVYGTNPEESVPEAYAAALSERQSIVDQMAVQGIDVTSVDAFDTALMRKRQEIKDAAYAQGSAAQYIDPDFSAYAMQGLAVPNPATYWYQIPTGIANPATYARDNTKSVIRANLSDKSDQAKRLLDMSFMTDDEINAYSYYLANPQYGRSRADLYFEGLRPALTQRQGEVVAGTMKGNVGLSMLYGGLVGIENAVTGIQQWGQMDTPVDPTVSQYAGGIVREGLKGAGPTLPDALGGGSLGQLGFDVSQTFGYMVPAMAANAALPGIGPVVIGASAGGNAYAQSINEGHTKDQAIRYAVLSGLSEAGLESVLGMTATGGGKLVSMVGSKTTKAMTTGAADFIRGLRNTMISNGTEEYLQDVLVPVFNALAYNDEFKGLDLTNPQAVRDGLMGALVAVVGDAPDVRSKINATAKAGADFNTPEQIASFINIGQLLPQDSRAFKDATAADAYVNQKGKPLSNYQTGKLATSVSKGMLDAAKSPQAGVYEDNAAPEVDAEPMAAEEAPIEEAAPEAPAIELSAEQVAAADVAAKEKAQAVSMDRKQFTPELERMTARIELIDKQIADAVKNGESAKTQQADHLKKNGDVMMAAARGEIDMDAAIKQINKNVEAGTEAGMRVDEFEARRATLQTERIAADAMRSSAQGDLYNQVYQAELNTQLGTMRQAAEEAVAKTAAETAARSSRIAEIDAEMPDLATSIQAAGESEGLARNAWEDAVTLVDNKRVEYEDGAITAQELLSTIDAANKAYDALKNLRAKTKADTEKNAALTDERAKLVAGGPIEVKGDAKGAAESAVTSNAAAPDEAVSASPVAATDAESAADQVADSEASTTIEKVIKAPPKKENVAVADIKVDPQAYQFKGGVDASGVTVPITADYSPINIGEVIVHRRLDGSIYIADGHHRLDLAKRSGVDALPAIVLDESDGITVALARAVAAARNLSQGRGTAVDAAKLFRDAGIKSQDLKRLGLSENEKVVSDGIGIASLSKEYFNRVVSGDIDEFTGALMGKTFPNDEAMQIAFMRFVGERGGRNKLSHPTLVELATVISKAQRTESTDGQVGFLDDEISTNAVQQAEIAAQVKAKLIAAKGLFKKLANSGKAEMVESVGQNKVDTEANLTEAQRAKYAENAMSGYYLAGPLHDLVNRLATDVAEHRVTLKDAVQQVYNYVVEQVQMGGANTNANDGAAVNPSSSKDRRVGQASAGGSAEEVPGTGTAGGTSAAKPVAKPASKGAKPVAAPKGTSGLVSQAVTNPAPSTSQTSEIIKRTSAVAKVLYGEFGVPYTTKNKVPSLRTKFIGLYEWHPGVVITRTTQDIAAHAHEFGHALSQKLGIFDKDAKLNPAFKADIDTMVNNLPQSFKDAYEADQWGLEAFAEFMRNYLTDRNAAVNMAGDAFVRRFETQLLTKKQLFALSEARKGFVAQMTAEDIAIGRSRLASMADTTTREGKLERIIQDVADRYYAILKFDLAANEKGYNNADPSKRAYIAFSNLGYSITQVGNIIERALIAPDSRKVGKSYADVLSPITAENAPDFNLYLIALHDIDRQAAGKPVMSDRTAAQSKKLSDDLKAAHPEFERVQQELVRWWDAFIDEWVVKPNAIEDAAAKVQKFRDLYPNYVPTYRSNVDAVDVMTESFGDMGGVLGQAHVTFRKAKGGDQAVINPVESFAARIGEIVTATNKVLAMRRIHEAAEATPELGNYVRKIPNDMNQGRDKALKIIDSNGNAHYYQVFDKLMYDALFNSVSKDDDAIWKVIGKMTGVFKQLTTVSNPIFAFGNAPRDFVEAFVKGSNQNLITFTGQWVKAIYDLSLAGRGKFPMAKNLQVYYGKGGGDSSITPRDRATVNQLNRAVYSQTFRDNLRKLTRGNTFKERMRGGEAALQATGAKLKDAINAFNNVIEGSQRYAEFSRTLKSTGDASFAFYNSANVTTDFRRTGAAPWMHNASLMFAFMNAGIQGTYSWYRMAKESKFDKKSFAMKGLKAAVMFAMVPLLQHMLLSAMGGDDKEAYDLLADNVKEDNYIIPKFWNADRGTGTERFIKIPKPKGPVTALGDAIGRSLVDAVQQEGDWSAFVAYGLSDYVGAKGRNLFDAMNPYGSPVFAPVVQIMMNKTWYDQPIESSYMVNNNIAKANRIKDNTSSVAIWLAHLPGIRDVYSPIQMDYFLNQSFGVVGDYLTSDTANAMLGAPNAGNNLASQTAQFIKSRLTTDATAASDVTSSLYDMDDYLRGVIADTKLKGRDQNPYERLNDALTDAERSQAVKEARNLTKGGAVAAAIKRTSAHYDAIDRINASDIGLDEKAVAVRQEKLKMLLENAQAVIAAEEYMRKYVYGTPGQYVKVYGMK